MISGSSKNLGAYSMRGTVPSRHSTFRNSRSITAPEGCFVSFDGARGAHTVSKLGLAFAAWTRATSWEKNAFHKLPPLEDFIATRLTKEFVARTAFEAEADAMLAAFLAKRCTSLESLVVAHAAHFTSTATTKENRPMSGEELQDLRNVFMAEGVLPVSNSVTTYAKKNRSEDSRAVGFVASFRAEKSRTTKTKAKGKARLCQRE